MSYDDIGLIGFATFVCLFMVGVVMYSTDRLKAARVSDKAASTAASTEDKVAGSTVTAPMGMAHVDGHGQALTKTIAKVEAEEVPAKVVVYSGTCYVGGSAVWWGRARDFGDDNTDAYREFYDVDRGQQVIISGPQTCVWRREQ